MKQLLAIIGPMINIMPSLPCFHWFVKLSFFIVYQIGLVETN
jgi:hypothetical protein